MPRFFRFIALLPLLLAGCASTQPQAPVPFEIDSREYARVYEATRLVLRDYGFILDRQDYRFGRITTYALAAPTVAEPWHGTNSTAYLAAQNTLNDQRRRVSVFLDPAPGEVSSLPLPLTPSSSPSTAPASQPSAYLLRVEVVLERRQYPQRRPADAPSLTYDLAALPAELSERGISGPYWQPVGTDPYLEQRLLADIVRRSVNLP